MPEPRAFGVILLFVYRLGHPARRLFGPGACHGQLVV